MLALKMFFYAMPVWRLRNYFKGKKVAVVGNAESILQKQFGDEIDAHDIVIRFNKGKIISKNSQGTKTNVWSVADSNFGGYENYFFNKPEFQLLISSDKWGNGNFFKSLIKQKIKFALFPKLVRGKINKSINARATSGAQVIFYLMRFAKPGKVDVYGIDFFKTFNLYEKRTTPVPHDFDSEEDFILDLAHRSDGKLEIFGNDEKSRNRVLKKK